MGKVTCLFNQRPSQRCQCRLLCGRGPEGLEFLAPKPSPWLPEPSKSLLKIGLLWEGSVIHPACLKQEALILKEAGAGVTRMVVSKDCADSKDIISLWNVLNRFASPPQGGPSPCAVCKKKIPRRWEWAPPKPAVQMFSYQLLGAQQGRRVLNFRPFLEQFVSKEEIHISP